MAGFAETMQDKRATAFVEARRAAVALADYPGVLPTTEAEAYAVQDVARRHWPDTVAGWKVGLIQPPHDRQLGRTRLFGPIFSCSVQIASDIPARFGCIAGGFAAVEAEYVLRLGVDVPPLADWTEAAAAALVDAVHVGIEFAGSPFAEINDHGPLVTVSDFGNNSGLLLGPEMPGGLSALGSARCAVSIDGRLAGEGGAAMLPGGPPGSLIELLRHCGRRGLALPAGTLVSTGAATGVHEVRAGQTAVADFGPDGMLRVELVEAGPC
jgi:2-keto-4-pentenoate hydratase